MFGFLVGGGFEGGVCVVDFGQVGLCLFYPGKRGGVGVVFINPVLDFLL